MMLLELVMVFSFLQTCLCKMQSSFTKSLSFCKHLPDKRIVWTKARLTDSYVKLCFNNGYDNFTSVKITFHTQLSAKHHIEQW